MSYCRAVHAPDRDRGSNYRRVLRALANNDRVSNIPDSFVVSSLAFFMVHARFGIEHEVSVRVPDLKSSE